MEKIKGVIQIEICDHHGLNLHFPSLSSPLETRGRESD